MIDVGDPQSVLAHISLLAGFTEDAVDERSVLFISAREFVEALPESGPRCSSSRTSTGPTPACST